MKRNLKFQRLYIQDFNSLYGSKFQIDLSKEIRAEMQDTRQQMKRLTESNRDLWGVVNGMKRHLSDIYWFE